MKNKNSHYIAIIGGSVAGSEAAFQLAEKGFHIVVFDQMPLPYGKIEDGLPKWHIKLRDKEEGEIDKKLQHPNIRFVPNSKLGRDIDFKTLVSEWGFSAILIAIGAWKDRKLELPGIEKFTNQNFIYQNQLIKWFNHYHESNYKGPQFDIPDGAIVIGGGLSSIDVIKILQIVNVQKALLKKGIKEDIISIEKGIDRILDKHDLSMSDLGLKGATLFYRKTARDMPLKPFTDESQREKAREVSEKMLKISMKRYKFNFRSNCIANKALIEKGKLVGIEFQKTFVKDGQSTIIEGSEFEFESPLIISSIGSLPEEIKGLPQKDNILKTAKEGACRLKGYDNAFAIGNAVTGRGNIRESRIHGRESANKIFENHLDPKKAQYQAYLRNLEDKVDLQVKEISELLKNKRGILYDDFNKIEKYITSLQSNVGYDEDYFKWKEKHLWERMENELEKIKR